MPNRTPCRPAATLLCLLGVQPLAGCTGIEPALVGATLEAAERGVAIIDGTDATTFEFASYEAVVAAGDRAAAVLAMHEHSRREIDGNRLIIHYKLRPLERVVVDIREETPNITMVRVEVREAVLRGVSAIYLRQLFHELDKAGAYKQDWVGQSGGRSVFE